jgi:pimeloyl-ACP methyl ester carboxylesterase
VTVLLPGACSNAAVWPQTFLDPLRASGSRVILLDHRDSGRSPHTTCAFGLEEMAEDVLEVLDEADVGRVHVVGASLGGAVAQILAYTHPSRVAALSLLMTTPGIGIRDPILSHPTTSALEGLRAEMDAPDPLQGLVERWTVHASELTPHERLVRARRVVRHGFHLTPSHEQAFHTSSSRRIHLRHICCPTRIVHGDRDLLFGLDHAHALRHDIPGAQLRVLRGVGHDVNAFNGGRWAAALWK